MIFVSTAALAQVDTMKTNAGKLSLRYHPHEFVNNSTQIGVNTVVPARFYVDNLGFFCKKEIKFETLTGIPFKFRLGSVQYCDRMEGKINTGLLH